jgi:hypothetical protein
MKNMLGPPDSSLSWAHRNPGQITSHPIQITSPIRSRHVWWQQSSSGLSDTNTSFRLEYPILLKESGVLSCEQAVTPFGDALILIRCYAVTQLFH